MLNIHINSFSYKKGYPEETTGNGGGYAFDCRGILNPGRYNEYKKLSGLDIPVQDFLKTQTEMPIFLQLTQEIVTISIDNYLSRNFEHLQINFGCTGGQHRSVYAVEKMRKFIENKYGNRVKIIVNHCNKDNWVK
ncbi:MAG: RapZ C-terminal domain-containing protein [Flavobacterium sp.]